MPDSVMPKGYRWPSLSTSYQQEYYFFNLFRLLVVLGLGAFIVFAHVQNVVLRYESIAAVTVAVYALIAVVFIIIAKRSYTAHPFWVGLGVVVDAIMIPLLAHSIGSMHTPIHMLLIVSVGSAGLLLPFRWALACLVLVVVAVAGEWGVTRWLDGSSDRLPDLLILSLTYLVLSLTGYLLGRQLTATERLARKRSEQLEDLTLLNELVIRRMRTGVLAVDERGSIALMNEAAWNALGQPSSRERKLYRISPKLNARLMRWRAMPNDSQEPVAVVPEQPEVIPRFVRVSSPGKMVLVFLDDSLLVSQRAEALTLTNLGRLSASIAHEIRNPLSAISHAAQLLEEAEGLQPEDRQLISIMLSQSDRVNSIIENILALSRRERARPEQVELNAWVANFVQEYRRDLVIDAEQLDAVLQETPTHAVMDLSQLYQVVSNLVNNAIRYGRKGDEKARVRVVVKRARHDEGLPQIEVLDEGPGIPQDVVDKIFDPFFTTHRDGSGLGLYLANQLCEGNQASLEYEQRPIGGSCFRLTLAPAFLGQMKLDLSEKE